MHSLIKCFSSLQEIHVVNVTAPPSPTVKIFLFRKEASQWNCASVFCQGTESLVSRFPQGKQELKKFEQFPKLLEDAKNASISAATVAAASAEWKVLKGDLVLMATGGMTANLFLQEMLEIVRDADKCIFKGNLARAMCEKAFENSTDVDRDTPFSVAWENENGMKLGGGKRDDVTCIVCEVC